MWFVDWCDQNYHFDLVVVGMTFVDYYIVDRSLVVVVVVVVVVGSSDYSGSFAVVGSSCQSLPN